MNRTMWLLSGLGLGAGLIYILDPERGEQLRASARAQLATYGPHTDEVFAHTARAIGRQARGLIGLARQPVSLPARPRTMPLVHVEQQEIMSSLRILGYVGLGVGIMYMLDPRSGRRRRAVVRDKAMSYWYRTGRTLQKTSRDVGNRTRGLMFKASKQLRQANVPADTVLVARVLAQIGHVMARPGDLDVTAQAGRVTLSGSVPASERERLLSTVASVAGVTEVVNRLQVRHTTEPAANFQGN
jgi:hypothetical protein